MSAGWQALVAFGSTCAGLMWLAIRPAWSEWRVPTDCNPLPVSLSYTGDIDHFADQFRRRALTTIAAGPSAGGDVFAVVPAEPGKMDWSAANRPLISFQSIRADGPVRCRPPLFVMGDMESAAGGSFSALFAQGAVRLGPGSEILDWAYAEGAIHLGVGCAALRRISSTVAVELDDQCCFERINAPVVRFGLGETARRPPEEPVPADASLESLDGASRRSESLVVVAGDCELQPSRCYRGSLVVTGHLSIGASTLVLGDVKARKGVSLGSGSRIAGALTCEKGIEIADESYVRGPVISETEIRIGARSTIGRLELPTTVSAENIYAEAGAVAHGTVWARELGIVWHA